MSVQLEDLKQAIVESPRVNEVIEQLRPTLLSTKDSDMVLVAIHGGFLHAVVGEGMSWDHIDDAAVALIELVTAEAQTRLQAVTWR